MTELEIENSIGINEDVRRRPIGKNSSIPKIYYLHPRLCDKISWKEMAASAKNLGFSHLLLAWPFSTSDDLFVTETVSHIEGKEAAPALRDLARQCETLGLTFWIDLAIGRAAPRGALAEAQKGCWEEPRTAALDPRTINSQGALEAAFHNEEAAPRLIRFWQETVLQWQDLGISGLRCHDVKSAPLEVWSSILRPARNASPGLQAVGWMPEASQQERTQAGHVFDYVTSSVAWWNGTEAWLVEEYNKVTAATRLIGFPENPFAERRPAILPADPSRQARLSLSAAALLADAWLMPMGCEYGMEIPFLHAKSEDFAAAMRGSTDFRAAIQTLNEMATLLPSEEAGVMRPLELSSASDLILRRMPEGSHHLVVLNRDLVNERSIDVELAAARLGMAPATQAATLQLDPAMGAVVALTESPPIASHLPDRPESRALLEEQRIAIERVRPSVDSGRFAVKQLVGDFVEVTADIFSDGHDVLAAELLWRADSEPQWSRVPMVLIENDRWGARFPLLRVGRHVFAVEAWWSEFGTFRRDLVKKRDAGLDVALELTEGRLVLEKFARNAAPSERGIIESHLRRIGPLQDESVAVLLSDTLAEAMAAADPRPHATGSDAVFTVEADREAATFSSWYELFPRSITDSQTRHGTFRDVIGRLPAIEAMGFDVLYFPPIHPIGRTNRKGRNNSLTAGPDDPGSPYAIGSAEGGHDALHSELGSREDFRELVREAARYGLEIALDFAIQCSPDHPWLSEHPGWFQWRPDGSMRYAENPPKKYQDIVNVDFYAEKAIPDLWLALRDIVQSWVDEGVRIFRVDNPHTKPFPFWEWLIADIRSRDPRVLFLAEAFTRPKVMYRLGKIGFSQSYTYFTWRNTKQELTEYLTELNEAPAREIFRPHFFVNTPDINPVFLQQSGRPGFLIRAALAATLSGLWGVYSGFELCEAAPVPGKEEYLDSEKYEIKPRDWQAPGNIIAEITRLNQIRRNHPALQSHLGLTFYNAFNDNILYFGKRAGERGEIILVAVNLDPFSAQSAGIEVPLWEFGLADHASVAVEDLMRGHRFTWHGKSQTIHLDPHDIPFSIWRIAVPEGTLP